MSGSPRAGSTLLTRIPVPRRRNVHQGAFGPLPRRIRLACGGLPR